MSTNKPTIKPNFGPPNLNMTPPAATFLLHVLLLRTCSTMLTFCYVLPGGGFFA